MGYRVGLIDKDYNYAVSLMEYVNKRKDYQYTMSAFSDSESLISFLNANSVDLLVVGDDLDPAAYEVPYIRICGIGDESAERGFIYKYQSADNVAGIILQSLKTTVSVDEKRGVIYGIISPLGRCGKTRLSKALCVGGSSLYICLEEYIGWRYEEDDRRRAECFMYYWASNNPDIRELCRDIPFEDNMRSLIGVENPRDIRLLDHDDLEWLKGMMEELELERIVLDIGTDICEAAELVRGVDYLFVPIIEDAVSELKLNCFKRKNSLLLQELYGRVSCVKVPDAAYDSSEMKCFVEEIL